MRPGIEQPDVEGAARLLAELAPRGVASACLVPSEFNGALFPVEAAAVAQAVPRRRSEFAAGRGCVRLALARLGEPEVAIPSGMDRAPIWPTGIVGSISHCQSLAVAVVGRRADGIVALGVDIEAAVPLEAELIDTICTPAERGYLANSGQAGLLAKALFAIKESVYKAQYPMTGRMLEFHEVEVALDPQDRRFTAGIASSQFPPLMGQFRIGAGHILALTTIAAESA